MTPSQAKAIERIKNNIVERDKRTGGGHIKKWEVTESPDTSLVFLVAELGRENDEGTMAEVFCRFRAHYAIYVRGRVKILSVESGTYKPPKKYYNRYK